MKNTLKLIENTYDFLAEEYAEEYFGEHEKKPLDETIRLTEYCGKEVDIDFMFFTTDFITRCLHRAGFKRMDVMEREPYPVVEYPSRRAYVFAWKFE